MQAARRTTVELWSHALELGRTAGRNAATWAFGNNATTAEYDRFLRGYEDGDPAVMDAFVPPNLSGEWADSATPRTLQTDLGLSDSVEDALLLDELCATWLMGAEEGYYGELIREALILASPDAVRATLSGEN